MKRLHVHMSVEDLAKSIQFYSTLFAAEPTVTKDDYAKWMLDDPRVNFAISDGMVLGDSSTSSCSLTLRASDIATPMPASRSRTNQAWPYIAASAWSTSAHSIRGPQV